MRSDYPITRISRGETPCVGTYYDICPESPDGTRVAYSRFESSAVPGAARLVIAKRDGDNPIVLDPPGSGNGHTGLFPQWLDDEHVMSCPLNAEGYPHETRVHSKDGERTETMPEYVRMYSDTTGLGLVQWAPKSPEANPHSLPRELRIRRLSDGALAACLTIEQVYAEFPEPDRLPPADQMHFMNPKWSPDGKRFMVVFCNEAFRTRSGQDVACRLKCLLLGDADTGNVQFLGDFAHHPLWTPDGRAVIAMRRRPGGGQDLVRYHVDGDPEVQIEKARGVHSHLRADQKSLIVDVFRYPTAAEASVVRYDMASGEMEVLVSFNHRDYDHQDGFHVHPAPSRDGKRIYFNTQDTGVAQVYAMELG